jgi:S-adenosylmethionine synthetase
MIRASEAVLPGHPDKLCDFVAESIVQSALRIDAEAHVQVEASLWQDEVWLTGGYAVRGESLDVAAIARGALDAIAGAVSPTGSRRRWKVRDSVRRHGLDPREHSAHVNDQAIVVGWAGYDARVRHLPPEHFLALGFRTALWRACCGGELAGCGPDGKLLVRVREDAEGFAVEHVLVTLEHPRRVRLPALAQAVTRTLGGCYAGLRSADRRWTTRWDAVPLLVNPNGPLSDAGSHKDNGQTGRKLAMDNYGPRVPIGGGAIYGKYPRHVDRHGALQARRLALDAVQGGAASCLVRACYAPNVAAPLDVQLEVHGAGREIALDRGKLVLDALTPPGARSVPDAREPLDWLRECPAVKLAGAQSNERTVARSVRG